MDDEVSSSHSADAAWILETCVARHLYLACAESLTGGLLSNAFVDIAGASRVFLGSAVTYHLGAKREILGVDADLLNTQGAVDPQVAAQMADGTARLYSTAVPSDRVVGISTTGVAGPASDGFKPVGLVYVGVHLPDSETQVRELRLRGDRQQIRSGTVQRALMFTRELLEASE
ncbi:MAG: nicotinamide-nucleotide amidohydrolase family protein [Bifidobacteriaceae bacterium]|jgi:nicotinamide-nucleotide amidase|nr:nicotinamide-nucleotide amidohydrolase family protein [Bifidobacteriaceae bacterium]MCI1978790.1 nicotinamide-nucleotide amidohydrolase family protein [Bifidobacteriaceae bacterium]